MSRILFDHSVPRGLRRLLPGHDVRTAREMGWATLTNGELLDVAEREGFDVLITPDQNIRFQQPLADRRLALVILSTNAWPIVQQHAGRIAQAVTQARAGGALEVPLGLVLRRRRGPAP